MKPSRAGVCSAVTELGILASEALRRERTGRVIAVFERSFYVALGESCICIGSPEIGSGPLHVLCEDFQRRKVITGNNVAVADTTIYVEQVPFAGFGTAPLWKPERISDLEAEDLRTGLDTVDRLWDEAPIGEGLAAAGCAQFPLGHSRILDAAGPGVAALTRILDSGLQGHPVPEGDEVAELIGLGPGLTPSGDDLLGGALIALASLRLPNMRELLWSICSAELDRTNEISRAHLRAAASGYGASVLHAAIDATIGGRVDLMPQALSALSSIGHTSGRDGFAGVLIVLRAAMRHPSNFASPASA